MDSEKFKPVFLISENCNGCVRCMKRCPTEAIRVRKGKATITYDRCVGCGECVKICPTRAKVEQYDKLDKINDYKYKVALPCPSLYGQFNNMENIDYVLDGLLSLGFDDVVEVAVGAELVSQATSEYLKNKDKRIVLGATCPAVTNLIEMRYPNLAEYLSPILTPEEVTVKLAMEKAKKQTGLDEKDIGIFVIASCSAKVMALKESEVSGLVAGVLAIKEVYFPLLTAMKNIVEPRKLAKSSQLGVSWGSSTGEAMGLEIDNYLSVDGLENIMCVLNDMEDGKFTDVDYIELNACPSGCVSGSLNIENGFLARTRLRKCRRNKPKMEKKEFPPEFFQQFYRKDDYEIKNVFQLADNRVEAMKKMKLVQEIYAKLPQMDCGSCGAPNCRAFAEDVANGLIVECKFKKEN